MLDVEVPIGIEPGGYATFIRCKALPRYEVRGDSVWTDQQSMESVFGATGLEVPEAREKHLFDFQRWIVERALKLRRFAAFADCGLGKTAVECAWAFAVARHTGKRVLFLAPLAVMEDIQRFCERFYGGRLSNLRSEKWSTQVALLNWESMRDARELGDFAGIVLDESSILKNGQGKTRKWLTALAKTCEWRLAASATPSPNDQSEYATHAVWLGYASTLNEFLGRFFKKDNTEWRLKGHAIEPFYRHLAAWACYVHSPSALGFHDTAPELGEEPDYRVLATSAPEYRPDGQLLTTHVSLQDSRRVFGAMRSDVDQPRFRSSIEAVASARRLIAWAARNAEEQALHRALGGHLITGTTPVEERVDKIDDFRAGRVKVLVSKPSILGFGVNMPEATDMLYSGYTWSFEQFYQAVRRAHRFGRVGRLRVHVPVTDVERPVWESLRGKMSTFDDDVRHLQQLMMAS